MSARDESGDGMLSLLVVNIDFVMSKNVKAAEFQHLPKGTQLPVVRVFGSTSQGQRACAHIHGFLPYIYFRPENYAHAVFESEAQLERLLPVLEASIEDLLNMHRQPTPGVQYFAKKRRHIHWLEIVKRKTLYGMWLEPIIFVKAHLYDPSDIARLATIMDEGLVAGIQFQTFEAHIPYVLKFTSDFNVSPMDWIQFSSYDTRGECVEKEPQQENHDGPPPSEVNVATMIDWSALETSQADLIRAEFADLPTDAFVLTQVPCNLIGYNVARASGSSATINSSNCRKLSFARESVCELELDVCVNNILNTQREASAFGCELWAEERARCARKKQDIEPLPTHAFTQSIHRQLYETDSEFLHRFVKLQQKGMALKRKTRELVRQRLGGRSTDVKGTDVLLSQFLPSSHEGSPDQCNAIDKDSASNKLDKWATEVIEQTLRDHSSQVEVLECSLVTHSESALDEYVKSQLISQSARKSVRIQDTIIQTYPFSAQEMEAEREATQEEIECEAQNILSSTQLGTDDGRESVVGTPFSAAVNPELSSPLVSDEKMLLSSNSHRGEPSFWSYSTPINSELPKNESSKTHSPAVESIESLIVKASPGLETLKVTTRQSILSSIRKRKLDGEHNRLTSAFVKRKKVVSFAAEELTTQPQSENMPPAAAVEEPVIESPIPLMHNKEMSPAVISLQRTISFMNAEIRSPNLSNDNNSPAVTSDHRPTVISSPITEQSDGRNSIAINLFSAPVSTSEEEQQPREYLFIATQKNGLEFREKPPARRTLRPLDILGLPLVLNPPLSYNNDKDNMDSQATRSVYSKYMTSQRPIRWSKDCPNFQAHGNMTRLSINKTLYPQTEFTQLPTYGVNRSRERLLLPSFYPPPRANLRVGTVLSEPLRDAQAQAALASQLHIPTPTPHSLTDSESEPSASLTDTASPSTAETSTHNNYEQQTMMRRIVTMSMECFALTRKELLPNPVHDAVQMIVWIAEDATGDSEEESVTRTVGVIVSCSNIRSVGRQVCVPLSVAETESSNGHNAAVPLPHMDYSMSEHEMRSSVMSALGTGLSPPSLLNMSRNTTVQIVADEHALFQTFFAVFREWDPDFLMGYELEKASYGYLIRRGREIDIDVFAALSRMPQERASFRNRGVFERAAELNRERIRNKERIERGIGQASVPRTNEDGHLLPRSALDARNEASTRPRDADGTGLSTSGRVSMSNGEDEDASLFITGRTLLSVWEVMRSEVRLTQSTIQAVAWSVLQRQIPCFSSSQLTRWFRSSATRHRTVHYMHMMTICNLLLFERLDLFRKYSESARLYGIDFYSVMNRGSQYRVEASLIKKAHSLGFILLSPSKYKVAAQAAMEVIPLVLEPASGFYEDPVIVLDFQSLYPSMMIAYNLCFSTCMGKLRPGADALTSSQEGSPNDVQQETEDSFVLHSPNADHGLMNGDDFDGETTGQLGVTVYPEAMSAIHASLHSPLSTTASDPHGGGSHGKSPLNAEQRPYVSPNGVAFCAKSIRQGVLPLMVKEMLDTRVMLKRSMKRHCTGNKESQRVLSKVLDARQLAVKLLSNVTYGYTAAGFSGRMPMAELADSIVQSGRSTLEWTMNFITNHPHWQARVLYGDTDSVFVHLPGRSMEQAFLIGEEIAREITARQPAEVVLKFEKVYSPCILVTKKRYVGRSFETMDAIRSGKGHLDAKGIEMIRRDQCPATQKLQEKTLRMLFENKDVSAVKEYLLRQFNRILKGDMSLAADCVFAKEVKFGEYASVGSLPPGAIVATKGLLKDPMSTPPRNWRVPYLVVQGLPNAQLKDLVYHPIEYLQRGSPLRINSQYYLGKCILPALDRLLSLCGVDVFSWFRSLPRPRLAIRHINYDVEQAAGTTLAYSGRGADGRSRSGPRVQQTTMDTFTAQSECELCSRDALPKRNLCHHCLHSNTMQSLMLLTERLNISIKREKLLQARCEQCSGLRQGSMLFAKREMIGSEACETLTCPVFHDRNREITRIEDFLLATQHAQSVK